MKNFEITLIARDVDKINCFEKAEADTLVELMAKLLLIVVKVQQQQHEMEKRKIRDDDIPF